jgi:hypothetical protein
VSERERERERVSAHALFPRLSPSSPPPPLKVLVHDVAVVTQEKPLRLCPLLLFFFWFFKKKMYVRDVFMSVFVCVTMCVCVWVGGWVGGWVGVRAYTHRVTH